MPRLRLWQRGGTAADHVQQLPVSSVFHQKSLKCQGIGMHQYQYLMGSDVERKLFQLYFQTYKSFLLDWFTHSMTVTSTCCMSRKAVLDRYISLLNTHANSGGEGGPFAVNSCTPLQLCTNLPPQECVRCLSGWLGTSMAFELRFILGVCVFMNWDLY